MTHQSGKSHNFIHFCSLRTMHVLLIGSNRLHIGVGFGHKFLGSNLTLFVNDNVMHASR